MNINLYKIRTEVEGLEKALDKKGLKIQTGGKGSMAFDSDELIDWIDDYNDKGRIVYIRKYLKTNLKSGSSKTDSSFIMESITKNIKLSSYVNSALEQMEFDYLLEKHNKSNDNERPDSIMKKNVNPDSIYLIDIYKENKDKDKENNHSRYAISFGRSYKLLEEFCDKEFAFKFISSFNNVNIKSSYILYPFLNTDKTLNGHKGVENIYTKAGGFIKKIDLTIPDFGASKIGDVLTDQKTHSASDHLTFSFSHKAGSDMDENARNIMLYTIFVDWKFSNQKENKYNILIPVHKSLQTEIFTSLLNSSHKIESRISLSGLLDKGNDNFATYIDAENFKLGINKKKVNKIFIDKKYFDDLKFNDDLIIKLKDIFANDNEIKSKFKDFKKFIDSVVVNDEDGYFVGNLMSFFDIYAKYEGNEYLVTDGNIYKPNKSLVETLKRGLQNLNDISVAIPKEDFDIDRMISKLKIDPIDLYETEEKTKARLYYSEIMFNQALVKHINKTTDAHKSINLEPGTKAILMDTKLDPDSKIEMTDILFVKDEKFTYSHVKFKLDNRDLSYNIDQSLASLALVELGTETLKDNFKKITNIDFEKDKIDTFELIIPLDSDQFKLIAGTGKVDWFKLKDRMISKLKLLEWISAVSQERFKPSIKIIEMNSKFKDWKKIVDPNDEFDWTKKKIINK